MDVNLDLTSIPSELLRCLQVGLLFVQMFPEDRPEMSTVVFMLQQNNIRVDRSQKCSNYLQKKKPMFWGV